MNVKWEWKWNCTRSIVGIKVQRDQVTYVPHSEDRNNVPDPSLLTAYTFDSNPIPPSRSNQLTLEGVRVSKYSVHHRIIKEIGSTPVVSSLSFTSYQTPRSINRKNIPSSWGHCSLLSIGPNGPID